jgi:hypothetical protein
VPKKKEPPLTPEEQRKRFEQLAKETGASRSTENFRRMLGSVLKPKKKPIKK